MGWIESFNLSLNGLKVILKIIGVLKHWPKCLRAKANAQVLD